MMNPGSRLGIAARLFGQLGPQRPRLMAVLVLRVLYLVVFIWAPFQSAVAVNDLWAAVQPTLAGEGSFSIAWDPLGSSLALLTLLYVLQVVFYWASVQLMASVAETLNLQLRESIAAKLNRLPLRFFDGHQPGEVLTRVTGDLDKISETMQTGLLQLITAVGTIAGVLGVMIYYSVGLTLVYLAFMALSGVLCGLISKRTLSAADERQETLGALTGLVEEYYTGRNVIRACNQEQATYDEVRRLADANRVATRRADIAMSSMNPVMRTIQRVALAVIAVSCGGMMLSGAMTVGVAQAFFQYVNMAAEPFVQAAYMVNSLQSALASARRTFELLDAPEEEPDCDHPMVVADASGAVTFEHVRFGYDPEKPLMRDVSFGVLPGQKVAVVGPTGAGKTTLINLLMRFYEVDGGRITLDGVPTRELTRDGLRDNFGMVLQDTWLFGGTIADNIAYAKPDATREEIVEAAKAARVDHFIRTMPQGYDTVVDNDGSNLSQGQRQLITIARVFLRNPPVIILDEATSSVDTRTEVEIGRAMDRLMHGRTSFVIAHRLSTIRDADLILYMDHGTIVEQGTHDSLLEAGGAYATLYNSQFA
ncbi:ABC transporter ATP-binding protein [Coriobacteriaceae bacterium]|nr:ABC transporter ATP-binding protein [Granulimonas faecalis]MBF0599506.1 ABC transporter ATP-binding protein [Atopobiaceae bacterium FL090493]TGY59294.1 ABC transporter ATP-binding protein [Coriobacteriaceae bacterium]